MMVYAVRELMIAVLLLGSIGGIRGSTNSGYGKLQVQTDNSHSSPKASADRQEQKKLHLRCVEAAESAERDAAAMIPGRTWTWRLGFERSRQQLGQLRRDFTALRDIESEFEASLTLEQKSKVKTELTLLSRLEKHLEKDAASLDLELRKGYPTRWHVARDASDMRTEVRRWRKLHDQTAERVVANP
jgi:hypothetical protein